MLSDSSLMFGIVIKGILRVLPLIFLILTAAILFRHRTVKGWFGEKITAVGLLSKLDKDIYHAIHDVIIPAPDGTTQVDHVLVSKYGLFVIETKNIRGWIYGDTQNDRWTQNVYGKKSQFQNPLKQNYRHTKCLAEFLKIDHGLIRSVVFFIGDCEFKTPMPSNVLNQGLSSYIEKFTQECLKKNKVKEIKDRLLALKQDKSLNHRTHLASLRERHDLATTCPKCGAQLIERIAKQGSHAGNTFVGCSNYPRCNYLREN